MGIARSTYYEDPKGSARRHRPGRGHARDQGRVRSLRMAAHAGGAQASRLDREPQEGQTPDARACLASAAQTPLRCHHRQRSRRARLSRPLQGLRDRWPEPALGRRSDLYRDPRRLRLSGRDHGCVVAPHHRLRDRPADRCQAHSCRAGNGDRRPQPAPGCIHHSDRGSQYAAQAYAPCSANMAWSARWRGAATPTTTR